MFRIFQAWQGINSVQLIRLASFLSRTIAARNIKSKSVDVRYMVDSIVCLNYCCPVLCETLLPKVIESSRIGRCIGGEEELKD